MARQTPEERRRAGAEAWKRWRARNPEDDREQRREKQARYRERNPEKARAQVRRARARNAERYNEAKRLRRRGQASERRPISGTLARITAVSAYHMPASTGRTIGR